MKYRPLHFVSFWALFISAALLFSFLLHTTYINLPLATETDGEAARRTVIVLDAGHGGEDGGATGVNGVLEKDLNLKLTRDLASLLRLAGYTVIETRTTDTLLYDAGTKKGHKKQGDLKNRLAVAERFGQCVLISIHMNTFPDPSCEGMQVWYSLNRDDSRELAESIQASARQLLQPQNNRRVKAATSGIYLLKNASTPAVLVECGFLSSPADCRRLCDPAYQQKLTVTLFAGICEKVPAKS